MNENRFSSDWRLSGKLKWYLLVLFCVMLTCSVFAHCGSFWRWLKRTLLRWCPSCSFCVETIMTRPYRLVCSSATHLLTWCHLVMFRILTLSHYFIQVVINLVAAMHVLWVCL